jgi:hypothetical protein
MRAAHPAAANPTASASDQWGSPTASKALRASHASGGFAATFAAVVLGCREPAPSPTRATRQPSVTLPIMCMPRACIPCASVAAAHCARLRHQEPRRSTCSRDRVATILARRRAARGHARRDLLAAARIRAAPCSAVARWNWRRLAESSRSRHASHGDRAHRAHPGAGNGRAGASLAPHHLRAVAWPACARSRRCARAGG